MEKTFIQWIEHINTGRSIKLKQFEYIANQIYQWYSIDVDGNKNDLGKMKMHKLFIFLISSSEYLLNKFNNIEGTAFGRYEDDIFQYMKKFDSYDYISITKDHTEILPKSKLHLLYEEVSVEFKIEVEKAFRILKTRNSKIILLPTFDLIDIDRYHYSAKKAYDYAKSNNKSSSTVSIKDILIEDKIYHKSVF